VTVDEVASYSLGKPGAEETYPFGESELVAKVGGKAFAFIGLETGAVGLKCAPTAELAEEWRARYPADITISSYIGRYGWNSVKLGGAIPEAELRELVDCSYDLVVAKLPRAKRP
jgi:predicted DNA-binding protein (MmcQ/YjbR family)